MKRINKLLLFIFCFLIVIIIGIRKLDAGSNITTTLYNDSGIMSGTQVYTGSSNGAATFNGAYTGTVPNSATPGVAGDSANCFKAQCNTATNEWWGVFVPTTSPMNMSAYSGGSLKFWINTSTYNVIFSLEYLNASGAKVQKSRSLLNSGYVSGTDRLHWKEITIALSLYTSQGVNLTKITGLFIPKLTSTAADPNQTFYIDNVRWLAPGGAVTTINIAPNSPSLMKGQTQNLTATSYNAGGLVVDPSPPLAWTVQYSTVGSVNPASGNSTVFTANSTDKIGDKTRVYAMRDATGTATVSIIGVAGPGATKVQITSNRVYVDDNLFTVKGFCGEFTPVGQNYTYDWSVSTYNYRKDSNLIKAVGANTLRLYKVPSSHDALMEFFNNGIYVILTYPVSATDVINDPTGTNSIIPGFKNMVYSHMNYPYTLFWCVGNEVNKSLTTDAQRANWYVIVDSCAKVAHELEQSQGIIPHPVTTANAEIAEIGNATYKANDAFMAHLDFWSTQVYRGPTFGNLFTTFVGKSAKPLLLTEYGCDAWNGSSGVYDQVTQSNYLLGLWGEIQGNLSPSGTSRCLGGVLFEWRDEWWKAGNVSLHDTTSGWTASGYSDPYMNEEWWGVCAISSNVADRNIRQAYYSIKEQWGGLQTIQANINGGSTLTWGGTITAGSQTWKVADYPITVTANTTFPQFVVQFYTDNCNPGANPKYIGPLSTPTGRGFNLVGVSSTSWGLAMCWKVTTSQITPVTPVWLKDRGDGSEGFTDYQWRWMKDKSQTTASGGPYFSNMEEYIRVWSQGVGPYGLDGVYWADHTGTDVDPAPGLQPCPAPASAQTFIYVAVRLNDSYAQQYTTNKLILDYIIP